MTINPTYWPDSVAFKRYIRELTRQVNYVPPYQDPQRTEPVASTAKESFPSGANSNIRVGEWSLATNDRGDVVWRHDTGYEQIVASLPGD